MYLRGLTNASAPAFLIIFNNNSHTYMAEIYHVSKIGIGIRNGYLKLNQASRKNKTRTKLLIIFQSLYLEIAP